MQRLNETWTPSGSPVKIVRMTCQYQQQKGGVHAAVDFQARKLQSVKEGSSGDSKADSLVIEAVEFTFVLLDIFDNFLSSIQGIAGPGKYAVGNRIHKAKWILELDGAFSQYHALCFVSQARMLDGRVWKCNRDECMEWVNSILREADVSLGEEDIFPSTAAREGLQD